MSTVWVPFSAPTPCWSNETITCELCGARDALRFDGDSFVCARGCPPLRAMTFDDRDVQDLLDRIAEIRAHRRTVDS